MGKLPLGILFYLLCCLANICYGQESTFDYKDYFQFRKNKHVIYGQLIRYDLDSLEIELESGYRAKFATDDFRIIRQYKNAKAFSTGKTQDGKLFLNESIRRHFYEITFGANFIPDLELLAGLRVEGTYKWRAFDNLFLTGAYAFESLNSFESVYTHPITAGLEYVFLMQRVAPYIKANGGYGFMQIADVDNFNRWEVSGGLRYNIGCGFLFKSANNKALNVGVDYIHQNAFFESANTGWWIESERTVRYRRLFFKIGFLF